MPLLSGPWPQGYENNKIDAHSIKNMLRIVATSATAGNLSPLPLERTIRLENRFKQNKTRVTTMYAVVITNLSVSRKILS
jgi:hypothetical protein